MVKLNYVELMVTEKINIVKICVGAKVVHDLWLWQKERQTSDKNSKIMHITRMRPQRENELLNGGSIYWVFKGLILARQEVMSLQECRGADGILRCGLILNPQLFLTYPVKKRPFQGWRYLKSSDAPKDLEKYSPGNDRLPNELKIAMSELGLV